MTDHESDLYRQRIEKIIDSVFAGSKRAMALQLDVSPGLISRVVSGLRPASKKLLQGIEKLPQVNPDWLHTGKGNPIQTQPQVLTDIGSIVPVAKQLLTGPPLHSEGLLTSRFIAVPRAFFGEDVYAISVKQAVDAGQFNGDELASHFLTGADILIIDANSEVCLAAEQCGNNRLLVFLTPNGRPILSPPQSLNAAKTATQHTRRQGAGCRSLESISGHTTKGDRFGGRATTGRRRRKTSA